MSSECTYGWRVGRNMMSALPPILLTKSNTKRYDTSLLVFNTARIIKNNGVAINKDFDNDLLGILSIYFQQKSIKNADCYFRLKANEIQKLLN